MAPKRKQLVEYLVARGYYPSKLEAEKHVRAGLVRVNSLVADKPGTLVSETDEVVAEQTKQYVGRGALKLEAALTAFDLSPAGVVCADVGCCTGGFTQVLLQNNAAKVYAIDVGYGDLAWSVRQDHRVVVMERTNARHVERLPESISFVTMDLSFISVSKVLPVVTQWLAEKADLVVLVKPQFEACRDEIGEGGIVRDPNVHQRVVDEVKNTLPGIGLTCRGCIPSPILGAEGNTEFLLYASKG